MQAYQLQNREKKRCIKTLAGSRIFPVPIRKWWKKDTVPGRSFSPLVSSFTVSYSKSWQARLQTTQRHEWKRIGPRLFYILEGAHMVFSVIFFLVTAYLQHPPLKWRHCSHTLCLMKSQKFSSHKISCLTGLWFQLEDMFQLKGMPLGIGHVMFQLKDMHQDFKKYRVK